MRILYIFIGGISRMVTFSKVKVWNKTFPIIQICKSIGSIRLRYMTYIKWIFSEQFAAYEYIGFKEFRSVSLSMRLPVTYLMFTFNLSVNFVKELLEFNYDDFVVWLYYIIGACYCGTTQSWILKSGYMCADFCAYIIELCWYDSTLIRPHLRIGNNMICCFNFDER